MVETHFLADLHLQPARPDLTRLFLDYAAGPARQAGRIYVLGDLFEYWIGDNGSLSDYPDVIAALRSLSDAGKTLYFMRGNRDFGVGDDFCRACGITILPDPCVINLNGESVLLSHGDLFCTDDIEHQKFRAKYTDPAWRKRILGLPVWIKRLIARYARARSKAGKQSKPAHIMDVNDQSVGEIMLAHGSRHLIHGHTHRPADHELTLDGRRGLRQVLSDWDEQRGGEILVFDSQGHHRLQVR